MRALLLLTVLAHAGCSGAGAGRPDGGTMRDGGIDAGISDGGMMRDGGDAGHIVPGDAGMDGGGISDGGISDGGMGGFDAGPHEPCDRRFVRCADPRPRCPAFQLPLVVDGCWGACVPIESCTCSVDDECAVDDGCQYLGCKFHSCFALFGDTSDRWECTPPGGPQSVCMGGSCVESSCLPSCPGTCGPDGCGGSCGTCSGHTSCTGGGFCDIQCGDGLVYPGVEDCDDGNTSDRDGCSAMCRIEPGYTCVGEPSTCATAPCTADADCLADGEPCNGATCDPGTLRCVVPSTGASCTTATVTSGECYRGVCTAPVCGDGIIMRGERCDDRNLSTGDGCSMCRVDPGFTCTLAPSICLAEANGPLPGELVFTEIMHNPGVLLDTQGEWVELLNLGTTVRNLSECVLTDTEGSYRLPAGTTIGPGERLTIASSPMPGFAPDLEWTSIALANGGDDVHFLCAAGVIDEVIPTGWPVSMNGVTFSLDPTLTNAVSNDAFSSWCFATSTFMSGDRGTPELPNDPCP